MCQILFNFGFINKGIIMKAIYKISALIFFYLIALHPQSEQQFAEIGNFKLISGETIHNCKIGYRTFGILNNKKSNAILWPTWFGGKSENLTNLIGQEKVIDSDKYFVIAVDALGNGVSSSPSNSDYQSNKNFPSITIKDMVNSQYKLLTEHLGINHLHAIIGGSMGAMQVFEWIVSYPDFMDRAIGYVGTPKLTSFDLLLWQTELTAIEEGWNCGQSDEQITKTVASIQNLMARTPAYVIEKIKNDEVNKMLTGVFDAYSKFFNSYNWAAQLKAMMAHNIYSSFDNSIEQTVNKVETNLFVIVSKTDMLVNPNPAIEFANALKCKLHIFENNCGHLAPGCEMETFKEIVAEFLDD